MNSRAGILSFIGVAIVLLLITPIMANSQTPGIPYKGYPIKGTTTTDFIHYIVTTAMDIGTMIYC